MGSVSFSSISPAVRTPQTHSRGSRNIAKGRGGPLAARALTGWYVIGAQEVSDEVNKDDRTAAGALGDEY